MESFDLQFLSEACGAGPWAGGPGRPVLRVCTDSRAVQAGDAFFALRGERFDGHDFLGEVAARGAVAVVVQRGRAPQAPAPGVVLEVEDPRAALGRLAARYRAGFRLPLVAVAGSNGKTTTKELIAALLGSRFVTLRSEASFNNDVGLPHTLLRLDRTHEAAVVELGTNHPGELAPLARMAAPTVGVLTSLGREHLEFFGDLAGVEQEEGRLAEALTSEATLVLGTGEPSATRLAARTAARVVRTALSGPADWTAEVLGVDWAGSRFRVRAPAEGWSGEYALAMAGRHNVANALVALATAAGLGVEPEAARGVLAGLRPPRQRLNLWQGGGVGVIDDSYNANADSMRAALQTLSDLPCAGRRVAVLGDMAELGPLAEAAHVEVGHFSASSADALFCLGRFAPLVREAAIRAGLARVEAYPEVAAARPAILDFVRPGDVVLVKASRSARLEGVASALRDRWNIPTPVPS
ncbi:MAG: UDP-N-acetylmuramoyl-tripeptide--D-alanyl-D-alanine ligase [Verrucomicrobiota bacterium]